MDQLVRRQRDFFALIDDCFKELTGSPAEGFCGLDEFSYKMNNSSQSLAQRAYDAFPSVLSRLSEFYNNVRLSSFTACAELGGMKLVLGGSSRFLKTHLEVVRQVLLYADTILIPDPILPWVEVDRSEEKFRHVSLIQQMFFLLHLKPVVDADLAYPPIVIFQSWDKSLEEKDSVTQSGIQQLVVNVLSNETGLAFENNQDLFSYAFRFPEVLLEKVEKANLFIAPGGTRGEPLPKAIKKYREQIGTWRNENKHLKYSAMSDVEVVIIGISERLRDQYHTIENATELRAQPLFPLVVHSHYFDLCAKVSASILEADILLKPETNAIIRALSRSRFSWLTNIPWEALVVLRRENANETFRKELASSTSMLSETTLEDIDRVSNEVAHRCQSLLNTHQAEARAIEERYRPKFTNLAIGGWSGVGAAVIPALTPYVATLAPLGLAASYLSLKLEQRSDRKKLSRSLVGVLAAASSSESR